MIRHFGIFKFKPGVSAGQIETCCSAMKGMVGRIPGLLDVEFGPYDSPEGLNEDFTHGFIMTFDSAESRDRYLPHREHERVKEVVVPCLDRVIVFDFHAAAS